MHTTESTKGDSVSIEKDVLHYVSGQLVDRASKRED